MKIWLLPQEEFQSLNNLKEVTNPVPFEKGMVPTSDGLFSTEIFGMNTYDRKHNWAYIDLKNHYLTPKVYVTLKALNRNFEAVIYGTKKFRIENGVLVLDEENGGTGIEWLYKNWDKINFQKNDSNKRNSRIDMLNNYKRDEIFITKFGVNPAFYRDVNLQGNSSGRPKIPEINDMYAAIIRNVKMIEDATSFDILINSVIGKTQSTLNEIYDLMKEKINGKNGYLRRSILGKSIDYCGRIVITATPYDNESVEDQHINFYYTGVPLSHCCAQLTPFIIWWLKGYFRANVFAHKDQFPVLDDKLNKVYVHLDNPEIVFNEDYLDRCLTRWINNPSSRFDLIELPIKEEDKKKYNIRKPRYLTLVGNSYQTTTMARRAYSTKSIEGVRYIERPMTWTDLLYMAASDVSEDKHVEITRYPMLDYLGTFISRVYVISTRTTTPMIINDKLYETYPVIDVNCAKGRIEAQFIDSYKICPLYLPGLDGDHDGDQITSKIIFTKEANEEAERIMTSKSNILTIDGASIRSIGNEGIQTLYTMTKFH
jgi:hypothetical protein